MSTHCGPRSNELGKMPTTRVHSLRQLGASIICLIAAGERQVGNTRARLSTNYYCYLG
jgi:hypothetical protein